MGDSKRTIFSSWVLMAILTFTGVCAESTLLDNPSNWETISGSWVFASGEVTQTNIPQQKGECLLKWTGQLPDEPFYITFEIRTYASTNDPFSPEAYLTVRSDSSAESGHGFGLNRAGGSRQLYWREFPSGNMVDRARDRSGKDWGGPWHRFALAVNGPSYEWYYPRDVTIPGLPVTHLILRGYVWDYIDQTNLVLRTDGSTASFRNIEIIPLSEASVGEQFEIIAPANGAQVGSTRPVLEWNTLGDNRREDLEYHIVITNTVAGVGIDDVTNDREYRPATSLSTGDYTWTVEAKTFHGIITGGEFSGTFTVPAGATNDADDLDLTGPSPKHFTEARPQLQWSWDPASSIVDFVELYQDGTLLTNWNISTETQVTYQPDTDLTNGLASFTVKLFSGSDLLQSNDTFAVRTATPGTHTIREDGVLLRDGEVFPPAAAYRDPSDDYTQTAGLEEAGFNLTHSYHFEGAHYYNIPSEDLADEFTQAKVDQLIADAKEYLGICDAKGIKVFLGIRRSWVYYEKYELIREYVAALMGEPALLTWYLYDEPDFIGVSAVKVRNAYSVIKETDPYHSVTLIYGHKNLIHRFTRSCDTLWAQAYESNVTNVMNHIDTQFLARGHSSGFGANFNQSNPLSAWTILLASDPGPSHLIAKMYAGLISKARGIAFYWYNVAQGSSKWEVIVDAAGQLNAIMPHLLKEGAELDVPSEKGGIVARAKALDNGQTVIVLLNTEEDENEAPLVWQDTFSQKDGFEKIAGSGSFDLSEDVLTVELEPLEGIALLLSDSPVGNAIPYEETFESYDDGFQMPGTNGWTSAHSTNAVVTTNTALISSLNAYSEPCGYPVPSASHEKVLEVAGTTTNLFNIGGANQILWVDKMIRPVFGMLASDAGVLEGKQCGYAFTYGNHPAIWHHDRAGGTNRWTVLDDITVAEGDWVRLTFRLDYSTHDGTHCYFQVHLDGTLVTNVLAWTDNDGSGSPGGSWFAMTSAPDRLNRFSLESATLDDLVVTTDNPLTTPMGVPFEWLESHGLTNGTFAEEELLDSDGDGLPAWAEWVADTVPTDSNSFLAITGIEPAEPGVEVFWEGGVQATQWLEQCTNLVSGGWKTILTNDPPTSTAESFMDAGATNAAGFFRIRAGR